MSAWAPLRNRLFLAFWLANLASLIGTWIHSVGAAWLMTSLTDDPLPVALVQSATGLPVFLLALPAGAMADLFDRRRLLLGAQLWMLLAAVTLGLMTVMGWTTPTTLLLTTVLLGVGAALNAPVWQAVLPELVEEDALPAAVALGSVGFNVARAIGPAVGGLLVAAIGPGVAFLVNASSFLGVLLVVFLWRRPAAQHTLPTETILAGVVGGLRYVRNAPSLRAVLARAGAFMLCGSALWALLPVVAKRDLGVDALHYGILLGCLGAGAVGGAFGLARLREHVSVDALVAGATLLLAGVVVAVAQVRSFPALCGVLLVGGVAWLALLSSFNTAVQILVPGWIRGRAVAVYLLVFAGASSFGGLLWGVLASRTSSTAALLASACGLVVGLILIPVFRLPRGRVQGLGPSLHWPAPPEVDETTQGPVLVTVSYRIAPEGAAEFGQLLDEQRQARLRTGAYAWTLLRDLDDPESFVEQFHVATWADHLRQHERVSEADQALQERIRALHLSDSPPRVAHFLTHSPTTRPQAD